MKRFKDTSKPLRGGATPGSFAEAERPAPSVGVIDRPVTPTDFDVVGNPHESWIRDNTWDMRNLSGQHLTGLRWNAVSANDICLNGATITESDLSGIDMRDAKVRSAEVTATNLSYADMRGANLQYTEFDDCNFNNVKFAKTAARGKFTDCTMYGTYINGSNLRGAELTKCSFMSAEFEGANCIDTEFDECDLQRVKFTQGTDLTDARFYNSVLRRSEFIGVNGMGAEIGRSDATDTTFVNSDFQNATFIGSDLRGSHFQNVNLTDARFDDADLSNTSFKDVNLTRSNIADRASSVRGARFLIVDTDEHREVAAELRRRGAEVTLY
ncbi:pentapeptide repeat-containing protein [Aeromicrobium sp. 179-A 4D2 NHS]|uniref:pentapeptide repeat-containing protein n=1 Tax=Aeromicrobium sp. 179-A 4D2 NHS TaxID=3142375 RepID=UPI0039A236D5